MNTLASAIARFGPALLLSLHWRRMNGRGVLCGMVTGAVTTVVWTWVPGLDGMISVRFVSWALALLACWLGARSVAAPPRVSS